MTKYLEEFMRKRGFLKDDLNKLSLGYYHYTIEPNNHLKKVCHELYKRKDKVCTICPDYDTDGIMSGVVLYVGLNILGFKEINIYYPNMNDGYGLNEISGEKLLKEYPNTDFVITSDNGIKSDDGINYLKRFDVDVIVTDHHTSDIYPENAVAWYNPNAIGCDRIFKDISGAYVAYEVLLEYSKNYKRNCFDYIKSLLVFVGISLVSDVMPMLYENRNVVKYSLNYIETVKNSECYKHQYRVDPIPLKIYKRAFNGLNELIKFLQNKGKLDIVNEDVIGFYISPLLNASRRVFGSSKEAFDVFIGSIFEDGAVENIYKINEKRKYEINKIVKPLFLDIYNVIDDKLYHSTINPCTVIVLSDVNVGYLGLVSGKFLTEFEYPNAVIMETEKGVYKGSMRSPADFDLKEFCDRFEKGCEKGDFSFGGHRQAGGITISESLLSKFSWELYHSFINRENKITKEYDIELNISDLEFTELKEFINECNFLRPFGACFEKPKIKLNIDGCFEIFEIGKNHSKIKVGDDIEILIWNSYGFLENKDSFKLCNINIGLNEFRGDIKVNLMANIEDVKI